MLKTKHHLLFLYFLMVLLVMFGSCQREDTFSGVEPLSGSKLVKDAPELKGLGPWINSEPFTLEDQKGKVILIDFWTYTCINCIRTLPYLMDWHEKYSNRGLVILGVHAPEFEFEKLTKNVQESVRRLGIKYPVAQDNNMVTWDVFNNRYWPAKYIFDRNGTLRYQHFGEGSYGETESIIRALLTDAGYDVSDIGFSFDLRDSEITSSEHRKNQTRELYTGTYRNYTANPFHPPYVGNQEYFENVGKLSWKKETDFHDPGGHEDGRLYINGVWSKEKEHLKHARDTVNNSDYIALKFSASEVNAVFGYLGIPYVVYVTVNGTSLDHSEKGDDILFDGKGMSFINVERSDMFNLVRLEKFQTAELKLSSKSSHFEIYSFTFGSKPETRN